MKHGWEYKKLGDVCSFERGLTYSKGDESLKPTENRVLRSNNVDLDSHTLVYDEIKYLNDSCVIPENKKVKENSIIMCMSNGSMQHIGKVAFIEKPLDYAFGGFMGLLIPNESIIPKYVFHFLTSPSFRLFLERTANGINISNLKFSEIKTLSIPVPPLSTQQAIVSELDKVNEIIEKKKQQVKELDNLAKSIFYEMFGDIEKNDNKWEKRALEDIVSDRCSISYGIVQPGDGEEVGVPVVRPIDMIDTITHNYSLKLTTKEISESYKRTILRGNEILLCVRGTTGLVSLAGNELIGCNVTRGITPLEFPEEINRWFMYYQIKSPFIQSIIAEYTRGIALKSINMSDLRKINLIVPPIDLQQTFADRIQSIEKQKELINQSIKETQTLFDSRMEYYFGE